jgi:hypothetical protein
MRLFVAPECCDLLKATRSILIDFCRRSVPADLRPLALTQIAPIGGCARNQPPRSSRASVNETSGRGQDRARCAQLAMMAFTQWHDAACRVNELPHSALLPL